MIKYAIIRNEETKAVDVGLGTDTEFYKSIGMEEMEVEEAYDGNWYVKGYAPEKPLSMLIEEKTATFKVARNAEEIAPIEWNGNLYDYDADSRDRLRIKRQNIEDNGGTGTIKWTLADNSFTVIGLADFIGINNAASKRSEALHYKYNVLKAQAEAATTKEELESIVW